VFFTDSMHCCCQTVRLHIK